MGNILGMALQTCLMLLPTPPHAHSPDVCHQGICFDLQKAHLLEQHNIVNNERGCDLNAGNLKPEVAGEATGSSGPSQLSQASPLGPHQSLVSPRTHPPCSSTAFHSERLHYNTALKSSRLTQPPGHRILRCKPSCPV